MFKIIFQAITTLWCAVSDKHTLAVSSLSFFSWSVLIGAFFFYAPVYNNETSYQMLHRHAKQWSVFNRDSADNNTAMIVALDRKLEERIAFEKLLIEQIRHEDRLYDFTYKDGNFKSDFYRKQWEAQDDKIKRQIERIEEKLKDTESMLQDKLMFAKRDR